MDPITKNVVESLAQQYPGKAVRMTHQFLDGEDGRECGFVPNNWDQGAAVEVHGKWWVGKDDQKT